MSPNFSRFMPICLSAIPVLIAAPLCAAETIIDFNIGAQPLADALLEFSQTSGLKIFYSSEMTKNIKTSGLNGKYTAQQGLQKLLNDTGLQYKYTGNETVTIENAPATPQSNQTDPMTLPKVTGNANVMPAVKVIGQAVYDPDQDRESYAYNKIISLKTDTPYQDIPAIVNVIPQAVLQDKRIQSIEEAMDNVAGVRPLPNYTNAPTFSIRGFSDQGTKFRNGFRDFNVGPTDLANIETIEVLKGPASTFYGTQLASGGTVNTVTKKPLEIPHARMDFTAGNFDFYRTTIDVNGAANDSKTVLYRMNAAYKNAGSFRDFVASDNVFLAPAVTWKISPKDTLTTLFEFNNFAYNYDLGLPLAPISMSAAVPISRNLIEPGLGQSKGNLYGATYIFEHAFNDKWKFRQGFNTSLFYVSLGPRLYEDLLYSGVPTPNASTFNRNLNKGPQDNQNYDFQNELYGTFDTGIFKHNFVGGLELYKTDFRQQNNFATLSQIDIINPIYGAIPGPYAFNQNYHNQDKDIGLWMQDIVDLLPNLKLLFAGRYDWNTRTTNLDDNTGFSSHNTLATDAFSPRTGLVYEPIKNTSLFFNWANSFIPQNGISYSGQQFQPAFSEQYEIGIKQSLLDNRLMASASIYQITRSNSLTSDLAHSGFSVAIGEQRSQGLELNLNGELLPHWKILAGYNLMNAIVTKDNDTPVGSHLYQAPPQSANVWTSYELDAGLFRGAGAGIGVYYSDKREATLPNSFQLAAFTRVDAAVFYRVNKNLKLSLNLKNLNDVKYYDSDGGYLFLQPGAPRTVMGTVLVEY